MSNIKINRKNYLAGKVTHEEYYSAIAKDAGIDYSDSDRLDEFRTAFKKDEHLNNIPLEEWDAKAHFTQQAVGQALKKRGDFYSLASGVCTHKQAVKNAIA